MPCRSIRLRATGVSRKTSRSVWPSCFAWRPSGLVDYMMRGLYILYIVNMLFHFWVFWSCCGYLWCGYVSAFMSVGLVWCFSTWLSLHQSLGFENFVDARQVCNDAGSLVDAAVVRNTVRLTPLHRGGVPWLELLVAAQAYVWAVCRQGALVQSWCPLQGSRMASRCASMLFRRCWPSTPWACSFQWGKHATCHGHTVGTTTALRGALLGGAGCLHFLLGHR